MEKYIITTLLNNKIYTQTRFNGTKANARKKASEIEKMVNPYIFSRPSSSSLTSRIKKEKR